MMLLDQGLRVKINRRTRGKLQVTGEDLGTRLQPADGNKDPLRDAGGLSLDQDAVVVHTDQCLRTRLSLELHGHVDSDFSPRRTMTRSTCSMVCFQGVALDLFRQCELCAAVDTD